MKLLALIGIFCLFSVGCVETKKKDINEKEVILEYAVKLEEHQNQYDHTYGTSLKENYRPKIKTKSMNTGANQKMMEMQKASEKNLLRGIWPIYLLVGFIIITIFIGKINE